MKNSLKYLVKRIRGEQKRWTVFKLLFMSFWVYIGKTYLDHRVGYIGTNMSPDLSPALNFVSVIFLSPVIFTTFWFFVSYSILAPIYPLFQRKQTNSEKIEELEDKVSELERRIEAKQDLNELLFSTIIRLSTEQTEDVAWEEVDVQLQLEEAITE
jgi:membrane protein insertase Oxa1/YidC/SpoIIIJ